MSFDPTVDKYQENIKKLKALREKVAELEEQVNKMYTEDQYEAYGEDNFNRGHAEGYREATDDCDDNFNTRMYELREYINDLNLTSSQMG